MRPFAALRDNNTGPTSFDIAVSLSSIVSLFFLTPCPNIACVENLSGISVTWPPYCSINCVALGFFIGSGALQ